VFVVDDVRELNLVAEAAGLPETPDLGHVTTGAPSDDVIANNTSYVSQLKSICFIDDILWSVWLPVLWAVGHAITVTGTRLFFKTRTFRASSNVSKY